MKYSSFGVKFDFNAEFRKMEMLINTDTNVGE